MKNIFASCEAFNVKVYIARSSESYTSDKSRWHVSLSKDNGEAKIEVSIFGASATETLERAWAKFERLSHEGLALKALPAPKAEPIDDDMVPF